VDGVTLICAVMIAVGLAGIVVPALPGLALVWGAVLVWALAAPSTHRWLVLLVATLITLVGGVATYALPGRRLRDAGVPWTSLALGSALGVVGFLVIPVVGLFAGFVLGIYLGERLRLRTHAAAWPSTLAALKATGWSMAIELATGLAVTAVWTIALLWP